MSEKIIQYVAAAANGDADAMAKLYSGSLKASYFLAVSLCANKEEAVEIVKKAYARAFLNIEKLGRPEAFEIWMKQNVAAVYKENRKFVFNDAEGGARDDSSEFLPESALENDDEREATLKAINELAKELKTAVILRYNNGAPVSVSAKFFGVSESTASALLFKAKAEILKRSGLSAPESGASGAPPVLTRIFQKEESKIVIDDKTVRDVFIYALETYNKERPSPAPGGEEAAKPETEAPEKPAELNAVERKKETALGGAEFLKQKIRDILEGKEDLTERGSGKTEGSADSKNPSDEPAEVALEGLGGYGSTDDIRGEKTSGKKEEAAKTPSKKPKINKKIATIIVAAVVALALVLIGVFKSSGGDSGKEPGPEALKGDVSWQWRPGGFEECPEIKYLDEKCCVFKSAVTGKYGLLDYGGNLILQPNYEDFKRCGNGRDYSNRGSYHSLVKIGNDYYEFRVENGSAVISNEPHAPHSVQSDSLGKVSYQERDRYFEGYAAARKNGKWGYVDQKKDKKVIPYEYEAVNDLQTYEAASCDYCRGVSGGLIPVKKDGKMGIINLKNKTVVPFEFDDIMPGADGVFIAVKNGTRGFILTGDAVKNFKGPHINVIRAVESSRPEPSSASKLDKYAVVSANGANVRSDAGAEYKKIGELDYGDGAEAYAKKKASNGKTWICIKYKGEFGWVATSNLKRVSD